MKIAAYQNGVDAALDTFGVRVAFDMHQHRMPDGPDHLGAERLSKLLSSQDDRYKRSPDRRRGRNEARPVLWGPRVSIDDGVSPPHTGV